jgi:putrescine importer
MGTPSSSAVTVTSAPQLKRALRLRDLILYGIVVIQPVAPMSPFGALSNAGRGHVVTALVIAMVGMLFTAISYGRMARAYPSAGSAFTYVGQEMHPSLGFLTGWGMVMDYMLNPMICIIWISQQANVFAPSVPYWVWVAVVAAIFTGLNILGIRTSAKINAALAAGMGIVIFIFFVAAARFIFDHPHADAAFFTRPFYDPALFSPKALLAATSIAVLTYIGFDGISTLSEEVENPRRNILLATVLTCVTIGVLSALQVYAAQLLWPASEPFPNEATAFVFAAGRAWAPLFAIIGITLIVANFGSGMGAHLGAARLLFGMGRSNALPPSFFAAVDPKRRIPRNNVIFVGVIALIFVYIMSLTVGPDSSYGLGAQMLNFGALIAFMGVNLAAFIHYFVRGKQRTLGTFLPPLLGFGICLVLWLGLNNKAKLAGATWIILGVIFGAIKTRGFKRNLVNFEVPPEDK